MGCGASGGTASRRDGARPPPVFPQWVPAKNLPNLLNQVEQEKVWKVWQEETDINPNRADALRMCCTHMRCAPRESQFLANVADPSELTYYQACQVIGILVHGGMAEKKGEWCGQRIDPHMRARMMFDAVDTDRSGALDINELEHVVRLCAPKGVHDDMFFRNATQEIMTVADADRSGLIDFGEWCDALPQVMTRLAKLSADARRKSTLKRQGLPAGPAPRPSEGGGGGRERAYAAGSSSNLRRAKSLSQVPPPRAGFAAGEGGAAPPGARGRSSSLAARKTSKTSAGGAGGAGGADGGGGLGPRRGSNHPMGPGRNEAGKRGSWKKTGSFSQQGGSAAANSTAASADGGAGSVSGASGGGSLPRRSSSKFRGLHRPSAPPLVTPPR